MGLSLTLEPLHAALCHCLVHFTTTKSGQTGMRLENLLSVALSRPRTRTQMFIDDTAWRIRRSRRYHDTASSSAQLQPRAYQHSSLFWPPSDEPPCFEPFWCRAAQVQTL